MVTAAVRAEKSRWAMEVQASKAWLPIVVSDAGNVRELREKQ